MTRMHRALELIQNPSLTEETLLDVAELFPYVTYMAAAGMNIITALRNDKDLTEHLKVAISTSEDLLLPWINSQETPS